MGFIPQMPDYTVSEARSLILFREANSFFSYLNNASIKVIAHAQHICRALNKKHILNAVWPYALSEWQ